MATNPDNKIYLGLGPQGRVAGTTIGSRYMIPRQGMLRFVERAEHNETSEFVRNIRILQQYQWSNDGGFDWYDIPLVENE